MYTRIMRVIVPMIMGTFLIIGLVLLFGIRASAQQTLAQSHRNAVDQFAGQVYNQVDYSVGDLIALAGGRHATDFARNTLINLSSASIHDSQTQLLGDFSNLLEQYPNYLAIRYVTFNGSVWSEATDYDGTMPAANSGVTLTTFAGDPGLLAALATAPGQVLVTGINFRPMSNASALTQPFLRLWTPVASDSSLNNSIAGAIQLDVQVASVLKYVQSVANTLAASQNGRRVMVADPTGRVLYDTAQPDFDYLGAMEQDQAPTLSGLYPNVAALQPNADPVIAQSSGGSVFSTTPINLAGVTWTAVLIDDEIALASGSNALAFIALVASLLVGVLICWLTGMLLRRTLRPVQRAQTLVGDWSAGHSPELVAESDDEIGQLMTAFQDMAARVQTLQTELEAQQERHTRNLDITARVSRETATLYDMDELLNRAINLICDEFGFYHAQVFMIDDVGANAALVYSHGAVGEQLLQMGHKIPVGSESVIGTVTRTGKPLVVNDTASETGVPHRANPLLPQTRAEMALPLQVGDRILGALDVQSTEPNAFQTDDARTFQILADEIAIALQNARLLIQSEQRVTQIDALNRQLTRTAWEETSRRSGLETVYRYDLLNLEREEPTEKPSFTLPIQIRGETVGEIGATSPEGEFFSEGDHAIMRAVADRVAIAIENARLFEETQNSLAETFTLYQLSRYLNEADTLEDILQAIIVSVMPDASSGQIGVFREYADEGTPSLVEITVDWSREQQSSSLLLVGRQLHCADHALLREMQPSRVSLVTNMARDNRLDDTLREIGAGARAMVLIPFSVRGLWRGVVMIEFPAAREFTEREGRIYGALIGQAGIAIDNRMLLRQNEVALAEIERLYAASRIINMAHNMSDLVRAALHSSGEASLDFELGLFEGEIDETGWSTRVRIVARSEDGEVHTADQVIPFVAEPESPLRRREPSIIRIDTPDAPGAVNVIDYMRARGLRLVVTLPLFSGSQPIAIFNVTSREVNDLSAEDYDVFRALTGQMSVVLQNRRLLEQTEVALDETQRLYAASRSIAAAADSSEVYQAAAVHLATASTSVHRVSVLLAQPSPSPDAPYVEYVHVWTRNPEAASDLREGVRVPRDLIAFPQILPSGTALISDVKEDMSDWSALQALLERGGSASAAIGTIRSRQRWYGVVICESPQPNGFNESYVNFMRAIADQVAIAVESLFSFEEAQMQAQRALALAEAGQLASRMSREFARSLDEVFTRVAQPANYDRWMLALRDESGERLETVVEHMPDEVTDAYAQSAYFDLTSNSTPVVQTYLSQRTILLNAPTHYPGYDQLPPEQQSALGKSVLTPVRLGGEVIGVLLVGRSPRAADLDDSDEQLVSTLAAQVAIAVENQRLLRAAESERERLSSVLASLPAGVLVLDPITYKPVQYNKQVEQLLGRLVTPDQAFTAETYHIYRSGTNMLYQDEALPTSAVQETKELVASDDVAIRLDDGAEVDLLMNAVPILNENGEISAIVAAFQDISALRNLERTLETNLRETVTLYETTRALAEAEEVELGAGSSAGAACHAGSQRRLRAAAR